MNILTHTHDYLRQRCLPSVHPQQYVTKKYKYKKREQR